MIVYTKSNKEAMQLKLDNYHDVVNWTGGAIAFANAVPVVVVNGQTMDVNYWAVKEGNKFIVLTDSEFQSYGVE